MKNRKQGVAVIIVLGLLALLMVLAVSFSITMRVERAGTANYVNMVKGRQLFWAGLAEAIAAISQATPGVYPEVYPDGDFLTSRQNGKPAWGTNATSGVLLMTGAAREHIPDFLLDKYGDKGSEWKSMGDGEGSVAYMILNISDMLDANYVGGAARGGGTNVAELVLAPNLMTSDELTTLVNARSSKPFETLAQVKALQPNVPTHSLVTYSRYPLDNNRTNAVDIGGTVDELLADQAEIVAAIKRVADSGKQEKLMPAQAEEVFYSLLDYIDTDSVPYNENTRVPNAEAIPMLNEISPIPPVAIVPVNNQFMFGCQIGIETWYPYIKPSTNTFELSCEYSISGVVTQMLAGVVTSSPGVDLGLDPINNKPIDLGSPINIRRFDVNGLAVALRFPNEAGSSNHTFSVTISISNLVVRIADVTGQPIVDDVGNSVFTFRYTGPDGNPLNLKPKSYQTIDPRFNWLKNYWLSADTLPIGGSVVTNAPTLFTPPTNFNGTNIWTRAVLKTRHSSEPAIEFGPSFNASNAGRLYSPLELGNLLRSPLPSAMFQSFRVFDQANDTATITRHRHQILEYFTTKPVNQVERGLVNPNTWYEEMLEPAFKDMPYQYVGGPELPDDALTKITAMFHTARTNGTIFSTLPDVLDLDWQAAFPSLSDTEREAIAAYSTGLLGVRQNLFLVLVRTTTAADPDSSVFVGRNDAMALVWRDPIPSYKHPANELLLYDSFIKHFQWLD